MTLDEQLAWYDALTQVRWKLDETDPEDPWTERILEVQDDLWWSSSAFRCARLLEGITRAD